MSVHYFETCDAEDRLWGPAAIGYVTHVMSAKNGFPPWTPPGRVLYRYVEYLSLPDHAALGVVGRLMVTADVEQDGVPWVPTAAQVAACRGGRMSAARARGAK